MNKYEAHTLLNQLKIGLYFSEGQVNRALCLTGDLDVLSITPTTCRTLREDGHESCYVRSRQMEGEGIGEGISWSMDWNSKRSGGKDKGIEK